MSIYMYFYLIKLSKVAHLVFIPFFHIGKDQVDCIILALCDLVILFQKNKPLSMFIRMPIN